MRFEIYVFSSDKMESFYKKAIAEYDKRLGRYCKIALHVIRKEKEWMRSLEEAEEGFYIMPGQSLSSEDLSVEIARWERESRKNISFFIQSDPIHELPSRLQPFSISDFTINASMLTMILYEQIYRGYRILHNHPYHK